MVNNRPPIRPQPRSINETLHRHLQGIFEDLLKQESIPPDGRLLDNFSALYLPLAEWIAQQHQETPLVIGINGSQGSGKSTLCEILRALLLHGFDKKVAVLSIDDLYKTRYQRQQMSATIHPLFVTRGVPGTHDVKLGIKLLSQLKQQSATVQLPIFDKACDDRKDKKYWPVADSKTDIVLFEGWCVGAVAEDDSKLSTAINELEKNEDPDARWRQYVNHQLKTDYQQLFALIDKLIMLKIPDFNKVIEWRTLQENKLISAADQSDKTMCMSASTLKRFIMHFERLTRHTLNEMPARADITLEVNDDHQISQVNSKIFS